ncbi:hypothetical protein ABK040_006385 [Willaertia magna]
MKDRDSKSIVSKEDAEIVYCIIVKGNLKLCEFIYRSGGLSKELKYVVDNMITRIPPIDTFCINVFDKLLIPYLVQDEITFLLLCDLEYSKNIAKKCCEQLRDQWFLKYKLREQYCTPQPEFKKIIKEIINNFNNNPQCNKIKKCKKQIELIQDEMIANIDKCLVRGEKIDTIVDKTAELSNVSMDFNFKAKTLQARTSWGILSPIIEYIQEAIYEYQKQ